MEGGPSAGPGERSVKIGERPLKHLAVSGVTGGLELLEDSFAGQYDALPVLLLRGELASDRLLRRTAIRGCLRLLFFDPLAFPAARHE